jgi:bifunctional hydroxylase/dehydrase
MREVLTELLQYEEVQRVLAGMVAGLDIRHDVGDGDHPLLGRRLPDTELTGGFGPSGSTTAVELLHAGRGVVLDLADDEEVRAAASPWSDRIDVVTATVPRHGQLDGARGVLVRPDGYVAWVGTSDSGPGLTDALARWFGQPRPAAVSATYTAAVSS